MTDSRNQTYSQSLKNGYHLRSCGLHHSVEDKLQRFRKFEVKNKHRAARCTQSKMRERYTTSCTQDTTQDVQEKRKKFLCSKRPKTRETMTSFRCSLAFCRPQETTFHANQGKGGGYFSIQNCRRKATFFLF